MRNRNKLFLSCTVLAGGLFAAAGGALADTCQAGPYTVETSGPTVVGVQTKITYVITGSAGPDHIAAVVSSGGTNCGGPKTIVGVAGSSSLSGNQWYFAGDGDPVTGLGKLSCHDEAAKINPNGTRAEFTITVNGVRGSAPKTVAVKKGSTVNRCEIVGIGEATTVEEVAPVTEIVSEPGSECAVEFTMDRITGRVLHAELVPTTNTECSLTVAPIEDLKLSLRGVTCPPASQLEDGSCSLGSAKFGQGYTHTGTGSCTTRVIGGRVYSWGAPCPE